MVTYELVEVSEGIYSVKRNRRPLECWNKSFLNGNGIVVTVHCTSACSHFSLEKVEELVKKDTPSPTATWFKVVLRCTAREQFFRFDRVRSY